MKITAKLAYSQLRINRSRTRWSVVAIALSTALTTAIFSFLVSGNEMLVTLLGEDYGEYGQSYQVFLLIPIIIFAIMIMAMTITVISNVFRISTQDRVSQFGIMKCTGATPKQIKETVMYESLWLCIVGIPLGLILGIAFGFFGIQVANFFLKDLDALAHLMMQVVTISLHFVFSWGVIIGAVIFSVLIVCFAAWRPAHKAAKLSAIDCIHGTGEVVVEEKAVRDNKLVAHLFGFEGILADKNLKRNRRNFRATVISLSIGVILFVSLGGLAGQAKEIQNFMKMDIDESVIVDYTSDYSDELVESTGNYERKYLRPIDSSMGEEITQKLEAYDGSDVWGMGMDMDTYRTLIPAELVTEEMQKAYESDSTTEYDFPVEIITLDQENYKKICDLAKVPVGSTILLDNYSYNDFGHFKKIEPLSDSIRKLQLVKADGSTTDVDIQGVLTEDLIPKEMIAPGTQPVRLLVPQAVVRGISWYCTPKNDSKFISYANQVMEEYFPTKSSNSYMEEGFDTRVFRTDEYAKIMNIAISLVSVFMYSFVVLLMMIGLTNVISTLSTNVMMRAKEFAVLKSVGMTTEGLRKMLNYESVLCTLKALTIGVPVGVLITIFINLPIRMMYPVSYQLPGLSILACIFVVFLITWGTVRYASSRLKKQNIIETIRSACGK